MTFEEIKEHCEDEGCSFEKLADKVYLVKNCINGECCIIEDLDFYNTVTLHHYIYELNISVPTAIEDFFHVYDAFRKDESVESDE